ncbi:MAG TPA: peptidoglycan DD-metalloendopeptidase family protein [Candidatus Cloacimonadota bacterium]|nr:peptidoglycan DD-metalloendopeptidase family protein [Candidatus Cloacimonadota bacterium]
MSIRSQLRMIPCVLLLWSIIMPAYTLDIEEKKRQLQDIENQIEKSQDAIRKAEEKQKLTTKKVSDVKQQKQVIDKNVQQLSIVEKQARQSLVTSTMELQSAETELQRLERVCSEEFIKLFYLDYQDRYTATRTTDKMFLSILANATVKSIHEKTGQRNNLLQVNEENQVEFSKIHESKVTESRKSTQYLAQMKNLQKEVSRLESEKSQYMKKIEQLRQDARELEKLITKLDMESGDEPKTYKFSSNRLPWPVRGRIIRDFGEEKNEQYHTSIISNGIDIAVPEGTSVIAVDNGEVVFADRFGGQGKLVIIDHKNGFYSLYAYNNSLTVSKGQQVKKGQAIALSGKTGSAREPSVHFELRKNGKPVNPLAYLQ